MLTTAAAAPRPSSTPTPRASAALWRDDSPPDGLRWLRGAVWLYILLWIFEGALRKWIVPGLANPLLVVRDPVLLLIYALALERGVFPGNFFVGLIAFEGIVALGASVASTDVPMMVQFYGFHANFLHLPLIFVLPEVFRRVDLRRLGFVLLVLAPPMSALVFLQFTSSRTAWINTGAGGTGGMLGSALGHIRPSGTFSFSNGLGGFTSLVAGFFLWQIFRPKLFPRLLWLATAGALVVMIVFSGSRATVGTVVLICVGVLLVGVLQPRYWPSAVKLLVIVGLGGLLVASGSVFKEGMGVFAERFGDTDNVRTGFIERYLDALYYPFSLAAEAKPLGVGLGMGTNAAAGIINEGKRAFLLSEGDIGRVILESGPVIGITFALTRMALAAYCFFQSVNSLQRRANPLPILFFCGCFSSLIGGSFAQPTELGSVVIAAGLCLAATRFPPPGGDPSDTAEKDAPVIAAPPPPTIRGRALHAERLHRPDAESDGE